MESSTQRLQRLDKLNNLRPNLFRSRTLESREGIKQPFAVCGRVKALAGARIETGNLDRRRCLVGPGGSISAVRKERPPADPTPRRVQEVSPQSGAICELFPAPSTDDRSGDSVSVLFARMASPRRPALKTSPTYQASLRKREILRVSITGLTAAKLLQQVRKGLERRIASNAALLKALFAYVCTP